MLAIFAFAKVVIVNVLFIKNNPFESIVMVYF